MHKKALNVGEHVGGAGEGDKRPSGMHEMPLTDEELLSELRRILESDPDCPLPERERTHGTTDPKLLWEVTGYLLVTVRSRSRASVPTERAYRIVRDELEDLTHQWALD
jgi:hypothetical protein